MSDDSNNLMLSLLRAIRGDIANLSTRVDDFARRMNTLEIQIGHQVATEQSHYANTMLRLDQMEVRLGRIEKRLDLVAAPA
jgi:hypothetical protein